VQKKQQINTDEKRLEFDLFQVQLKFDFRIRL